jgi:hypothetical protein
MFDVVCGAQSWPAPTPVDRAALPAQIAMLEYGLAHAIDRKRA